ncbi:hypothetical protein [Mitsuaria sp. GD03876]|uniref:hypothetical protein n=1 Tax=Mitsuaria sp. GD03876 TaxID=2975399 RepID=UPI00244B74F9|nr:hypothetical protein [Mitsuaria sp. GD03876]MDH0867574.1 hypothetical protein [Mitsuaria sp. GD03876]
MIDDFSGSGLLSVLRAVARLRNLDGPDDVAGAIPAGFAEAHQPYIEIGVLAALFPLVAMSAKHAVGAARAGYAQVYPDSVRRCLDQQQLLIDALRRGSAFGDGESDQDLARLVALQTEGVRHHEDRQRHRAQGAFSLLKHNLANRWHHRPGNGALCDAFAEEAAAVIAARFARNRRLDTAESSYQARLLRRLDGERREAKRQRTATLFTGIGMPGMAGGMVLSAGAAAVTAGEAAARTAGLVAGQAAAQAAGHALELAAGGVMMGAQVSQGVAGLLNGRIHAAQHRQLRRDRAAIRAVAGELSPRTRALVEQDTGHRLADSARSQACDAMLSAGQALMLGASVSNLACPPAALGLAVPGALLTVGASFGAGVNDDRRADYLGEKAPEAIKERLRLGNLGPRLLDRPLDSVLHEVGDRFVGHQDQLVRTRLWNDLLAVLKEEDGAREPRSAAERHRRLVARNESRRDASALLADGRERLRALRERDYPPSWFEGSVAQLHERLSDELWRHPASPAVVRLESFHRDVLFGTASALARRADPASQALFRDAQGRRLRTLRADHRFFRLVNQDDVARAHYLRHHNEALARHLTPADRFGRGDSRDALADLAHVKVERAARRGEPVTPAATATTTTAATAAAITTATR